MEYAASQPVSPEGIPQIPDYYNTTSSRINERWIVPLLAWPLLLAAAFITLFKLLRRHRLSRKKYFPGEKV
ncbi:MAG: hypothetical protein C4554_02620 [Dethiobacter sp.]|jgi:hypothetical protein|nr:MAG: hypothetical protein C4554_02620 [Dethiobacter sp.]